MASNSSAFSDFARQNSPITLTIVAHHTSRIKEVAAMDGARVIWLDPYSPDLSLIELMHSKIKSEM